MSEELRVKSEEQKAATVERWREALQESARLAVEALISEKPIGKVAPSLDEVSKIFGEAIHQIRELVRPEPKTVAFWEEEAWYRRQAEYRTPKEAIDFIMGNPPLGDLPPGLDGVEPRDTPLSPDAPKMERGYPAIFDIPELGIQWRRYYTPRYVHVIAAWNDDANAHVYQLTVRPWPLASGERWHVNVTNDGDTVFTMESKSKVMAELCGLAAMRAYIIRNHRKTWRKVRAEAKAAAEAARSTKHEAPSTKHGQEAQA